MLDPGLELHAPNRADPSRRMDPRVRREGLPHPGETFPVPGPDHRYMRPLHSHKTLYILHLCDGPRLVHTLP